MNETKTVLDITKKEADLGMFSKALEAVGLAETLQGDGPFTVLAPTDKALEESPAFDQLLDSKNTQQLKELLASLVIKGKMPLATLLGEKSVETLTGNASVKDDGRLPIDRVNIVRSDLSAANGVVHVTNSLFVQKPADKGATA
jgi:uncharacterized surface protein with fasciclin (FAS1) repeats